MSPTLSGIHHITAIAGDAQSNLDFYTGILGLRLVKLTVNYDDPSTYHVYYGDGTGRPGTVITFFPWPAGTPRGRTGTGQITSMAVSVPIGSLDFWDNRLRALGVEFVRRVHPFDGDTILVRDPDGLRLELVATASDERPGWRTGPVPPEAAIRGLHRVTLDLADSAASEELLRVGLGFDLVATADDQLRFSCGTGAAGQLVDLRPQPTGTPGRMGVGAIHHVAWRIADDSSQLALRRHLVQLGRPVSEVKDRQYFHSIYFREPGGVLFEGATDGPGFLVDETAAGLGRSLRLPPWLESERTRLLETLPPLRLPPVESDPSPAGSV